MLKCLLLKCKCLRKSSDIFIYILLVLVYSVYCLLAGSVTLRNDFQLMKDVEKSFWNEVSRLKELTVVVGWWIVGVLRWWWWFSCQVMSRSCDPMDRSPPGSSVHGISQARILEWVAILFSRGSFQPRGQTWVSWLAGGFLLMELPGKPKGG